MNPLQTMLDDVLVAAHLSPWLSNLVAYGAGVLGPLVLIVLAATRAMAYRRRAAHARAADAPNRELEEGAAIVAGTVEYDPEQPGAIEVEITQEGAERNAPVGQSHTWTEVERRLQARPFYLLRADGERIRVEPTESSILIDDIDGCRLDGEKRRICTVKLAPGERVVAAGVLQRVADRNAAAAGYRDTPTGWSLVGSRRAPLFLSTRPLAERFARWHRFHLRWLGVFAFALIGAQIPLCGHHARVIAGEVAWAEVTDAHLAIETAPRHDHYRYELTAELPWGAVVKADVAEESYRRAPFGTRVPVLHIHRWFAQYGRHSTLHFAVAVGVVGGLVLLAVFFAIAIGRARPWYAAAVVDHGKGPLDAKTGLEGRARWEMSMGRAHAEERGASEPSEP